MGSRRIVLITGCSSPQGIGFATARALAAAGHAVHATVRDHTHDRELLAGLDGELLIHDLDLLDRATMRPVLDAVLEADGALDVLINNAGYGLIGGIEQVDVDRARANFDTNFFGTVALIQEAMPLFRRQRHGHIINVSTIFAAGLCVPAIGYYVASKAALETVCQALAIEAAPWGVQLTNFQPGPVMTDLSREWGDRSPEGEDPRPGLSDELYSWVLGDESPEPQSPAEVAGALARILSSDSPVLADQSGSASQGYVAAAFRDPTRQSELEPLLAAFARSFAAAARPDGQSSSS